jgi:hypothetical protein
MLDIPHLSGKLLSQDNMEAHIKPSTQELSPLIRLPFILDLVEKTRKDGKRSRTMILWSVWIGTVR